LDRSEHDFFMTDSTAELDTPEGRDAISAQDEVSVLCSGCTCCSPFDHYGEAAQIPPKSTCPLACGNKHGNERCRMWRTIHTPFGTVITISTCRIHMNTFYIGEDGCGSHKLQLLLIQ
jgi:hypothetical protein